MKITCPICRGHGWADKSLADVGTRPRCEPCGGIGVINILTLVKENNALREKLNRIYEHIKDANFHAGTCSTYIPDGVFEALREAVIEIHNA